MDTEMHKLIMIFLEETQACNFMDINHLCLTSSTHHPEVLVTVHLMVTGIHRMVLLVMVRLMVPALVTDPQTTALHLPTDMDRLLHTALVMFLPMGQDMVQVQLPGLVMVQAPDHHTAQVPQLQYLDICLAPDIAQDRHQGLDIARDQHLDPDMSQDQHRGQDMAQQRLDPDMAQDQHRGLDMVRDRLDTDMVRALLDPDMARDRLAPDMERDRLDSDTVLDRLAPDLERDQLDPYMARGQPDPDM